MKERVDFELTEPATGEVFRSQDHAGEVLALHFLLKTECPVCLRHTRDYQTQAQRDGVTHVYIKPDDPDVIAAWLVRLDEYDAPPPRVYHDPGAALAKRFGIPFGYEFHGEVVHYPALVVLRDGVETFRYVGQTNKDRFPVSDFLARLPFP